MLLQPREVCGDAAKVAPEDCGWQHFDQRGEHVWREDEGVPHVVAASARLEDRLAGWPQPVPHLTEHCRDSGLHQLCIPWRKRGGAHRIASARLARPSGRAAVRVADEHVREEGVAQHDYIEREHVARRVVRQLAAHLVERHVARALEGEEDGGRGVGRERAGGKGGREVWRGVLRWRGACEQQRRRARYPEAHVRRRGLCTPSPTARPCEQQLL
mmetsp:Transcript_24164/g.58239  ORF Transcript_24164/g.58239 Transcript_24164/m.58239 type:complete len:215 (-) Transcript_24164:670-1314(-)